MKKTIERLKEYIDYKDFSLNYFDSIIGASNGYIGKQIKNNASVGSDVLEKIFSNFDDLNPIWLITGNGTMINDFGVKKTTPKTTPNATSNYEKGAILAAQASSEGIPLIPIEAMAGFGSAESTQVFENQLTDRYVIPEFTGKVDYFIRIYGSSMYPKYNSGDIVACKRIESLSFVQWNKTYVLDTTQGALVKRLIKSDNKGFVVCRSDNTSYADFELNINEDIYAIALVVGVIRFE